MRILNLTQHVATAEQVEAGVCEPASGKAVTGPLLTFDTLPTREQIDAAAIGLAALAVGYDAAMIGGAPFLMTTLEHELREQGVKPLYAFSKRVSVEETSADGKSVSKTNVFRHVGFVEA